LINNKYRINFSIVILPSLAIKLISNSSVAFFHFVENQSYKFFKSKKAGYYKNYGNKPTVRGVAKNPCDHPNGGRTKTILLSRTP
jgi:large subunit ribosomal protein L2